ncbi:MAG: hypothetical protein AB7T38_02645 [Nitrospirales bacterium]
MTESDAPEEAIGNVDEMVDSTYEDRILPVGLTKDERLEIGEEVCQAQSELESKTAEKTELNKKLNAEIQKLKNVVSQQSHILRVGKSEKSVQVRVVKNYREGIVREVRMDTMETLVHRPMTGGERQRGFGFGGVSGEPTA